MSVRVETRPRRGRPGVRRLAVGAALVAAAVVVTLLYALVNRPASDEVPTTPGAGGWTLHERLGERVAQILEGSTVEQHHEHGHNLGDAPGRVLCAAEVYGFEPADATAADDVRRVYGYHLCAVATPGRPWEIAPKLVGPLAVEFTDPPTVKVAEGGAGYQDRVREVVGERYFQRAMAGFSAGRIGDLRKRYDAEVGDA